MLPVLASISSYELWRMLFVKIKLCKLKIQAFTEFKYLENPIIWYINMITMCVTIATDDDLYKHCHGNAESCNPLLIYYRKVTMVTRMMFTVLLPRWSLWWSKCQHQLITWSKLLPVLLKLLMMYGVTWSYILIT